MDGWISLEIRDVDTFGELLKRWRFEEEKTAKFQIIQSSPCLLLIFKLHPISNLNLSSILYYTSPETLIIKKNIYYKKKIWFEEKWWYV